MAFSEPLEVRPSWIRRAWGRPAAVAVELIVPAVLIVAWWVASSLQPSFYFPELSKMLDSVQRIWLFSHFATDALPTLAHLFGGLLIALVVGITVGLVLGLVPVVADIFAPILEFLRAIPGVALLPAALLLLGIGPTMQITLIAYGTVWPILLNTVDGVRSLDPAVRDVVASYRIGFFQRIFRVVIPAASPQIVAGVRTSLAIGITVIMFSELIGSTSGIGYQILVAQRSYAIPDMWAGMIFLGIIGYLINVAFLAVEFGILRWHRGMRAVVK